MSHVVERYPPVPERLLRVGWDVLHLCAEEVPTTDQDEKPFCSREKHIHPRSLVQESEASARGLPIVPNKGYNNYVSLVALEGVNGKRFT
jgi:hypothetical protein